MVLTPIVNILSHRHMGCSQNLLPHVKLPFSTICSYPPQAQLTSNDKGLDSSLIFSKTALVSESLLWSHLTGIQTPPNISTSKAVSFNSSIFLPVIYTVAPYS